MRTYHTRQKIKLMLLNVVFILLCLIGLIPIIYAFSVSLNGGNSVMSSDFSIIPKHFTLDNYKSVLFDQPFLLWFKNSSILALFTVMIALTLSIPAAYAFSRHRFKGRKSLLYILLMLNAFPGILSMFAVYRLLKPLNLINSYAGLIIIYIGTMGIFSLWNMKGYFDTIPLEIEEAARIDGANDFQTILKIILPLARPTIIVTAVMVLIFVWNEYIFAVTFMTGSNHYTLAAGLYSLQATEYTRNWPIFSAASLLTSLPILIVFFLVQKQMRSGLVAGGVKG